MNTIENFGTHLTNYVELVQRLNDEYHAKHCPTLPQIKVGFEMGKRYVRVFTNNGTQRSVHSFVDMTNGNILKGSWKAPVKNGVRGNINEDPSKVINHHGPNYLR